MHVTCGIQVHDRWPMISPQTPRDPAGEARVTRSSALVHLPARTSPAFSLLRRAGPDKGSPLAGMSPAPRGGAFPTRSCRQGGRPDAPDGGGLPPAPAAL